MILGAEIEQRRQTSGWVGGGSPATIHILNILNFNYPFIHELFKLRCKFLKSKVTLCDLSILAQCLALNTDPAHSSWLTLNVLNLYEETLPGGFERTVHQIKKDVVFLNRRTTGKIFLLNCILICVPSSNLPLNPRFIYPSISCLLLYTCDFS